MVFIPVVYVIFVTGVVTGFSNAVNLTDGLDGLATGLTTIAAGAFAFFAYIMGRVDTTGYLNLFYLPGAGELAIFCTALMGASLGFLWFNAHPAKVFMGDTGSLAIGGSFGAVAVMLKSEFLLVIIGGVFVAEAVSVMVQTDHVQVAEADPGPRVRRLTPGIQDGSVAPSLREARLGRDHRGGSLLDTGDLLHDHRAGDAQAAMSRIARWRACRARR